MRPGSRVSDPRVSASITLRLALLALLAQLALPGGQTPAAAMGSTRPSISIAAASDLRYAMDELISAFIALRPDHSIRVTYGSSGSFFDGGICRPSSS